MTLENGQLITQATNQQKLPLFAESETTFFLKVVDAQMEFVKNEKGDVTHMALHQNTGCEGREEVAGLAPRHQSHFGYRPEMKTLE